MATTTYNFVGINSPSSTHTAFHGAQSGGYPINGGNPSVDFNEETSAQYDQIEASENTRRTYEYGDGMYDCFKYRFKIAEAVATVTRIDVTWEGYGYALSNGANLYIRNNTTPAWELLDTTINGSSDDTLVGAITSGITNYIDGSGYVYALAITASEGGCPTPQSGIVCDYVKVDITSISFIPKITWI